jgi:hypothetical protein
MGSGHETVSELAPDGEGALVIPPARLDADGAVISEAEAMMREILLTQVATPEGVIGVLREEFVSLQGSDDYFIPDNARWEVALLMRARGVTTYEISQHMALPYPEVLYWFHTPGIVQDIYSLIENEEWERLKIRTRDRAFSALADKRTSAGEAVRVVKDTVELFRPTVGVASPELHAQELLQAVMSRKTPLPKE